MLGMIKKLSSTERSKFTKSRFSDDSNPHNRTAQIPFAVVNTREAVPQQAFLRDLGDALPPIIPHPHHNGSVRSFLSRFYQATPHKQLSRPKSSHFSARPALPKQFLTSAGFTRRYLIHSSKQDYTSKRESFRIKEKARKLKLKDAARSCPYYPSLSQDEQALIRSTLNGSPGTRLGSASKIDLFVSDLRTLLPGHWLNDTVIDLFLASMLSSSDKNCFAYTTHFYTKLSESGYQSVSRWATRKSLNVLNVDILFIPVNQNRQHWCLAYMDNQAKVFCYFDSLNGSGSKVLSNLLQYVIAEADKLEPNKHEEHVKHFGSYKQIPRGQCPQQTNGIDCGVFLCQNAVAVLKGGSPKFSMADIGQFRQRMIFECIKAVKAN